MTTPLALSVEERTLLARRRIGQLVAGKWRLERLIGTGGMAAVFEAVHKNGARVAIKILHCDLQGRSDLRERFLSESYAANRVAHPGVVAVRDEGTTEDGAVFLVMDLLRGRTLAERLAAATTTSLRVGEVLEIGYQLLDVLAHAHERGIVHGDIKPENVFLTSEGRVKLLDFAMAKVHAAGYRANSGTTFGTPAFMPPEQALGNWADLDGRSDLWSLAATMYLLLSGSTVREPGSATAQLVGAMALPVRSLGQITALPRSIVAVVDRALSFDREQRFPDARSMQLALRAAQIELGGLEARARLPRALERAAKRARNVEAPKRARRAITTVEPVSKPAPPEAVGPAPSSRGALSLYVALGFAVGVGIVAAARLSALPFTSAAARGGAGEELASPELAAVPPLPSAVAPQVSALPAQASASPSGRPERPLPPNGPGRPGRHQGS
jgi:serine/threonine-protein kinase